MTAPFRGSGPWRGRGPFLGRGPWAGKLPFGFNAGLPFQINVTGAQLRDALADPSAWGTTGASTGWLLPGLGGARLSGDCRTSVAMQTAADGTVGYAAHNLLLNSVWAGAVAGSPGTQPTNWSVAFSTGSLSAVGAYDATSNFIEFTGAATRAVFTRSQTVLAGEVYTAAAFLVSNTGLRLDAVVTWASLPAGSALTYAINGAAADGSVIPSAGQTVAAILTTAATGGLAQPRWGAGVNTNATGTVRLVRPQLVYGPTALPYVPTTTAARFGPAIDWLSGIGAYGIRSESARTNLVLWSADMGNAAWVVTGAGATKVGAATALGAVPMHRVNVGSVGGAIGSSSAVYQGSLTFAAATQYTMSVIVRSVSGTSPFRLSVYDGGSETASADLTATTTPTLFSVARTSASGASAGITIRAATAGGVVGDIEVGGFQLEAGTEASSRILTLAAAATRAADTLVVLDSGWINQSEGTLVVDSTVPSLTGLRGVASLNDGTGNNVVQAYQNATAAAYEVVVGGATQASGTQTITLASKRAIGYAANNVRWATNNVLGTLDTSATMPTVNRLTLGTANGLDFANGTYITRIRYSRRRASNGQLQALTV